MFTDFTQIQQRRLIHLQRQKILILGAGREGLSTYKFLRSVFPDLLLTIADSQTLTKLGPTWQQIFKEDYRVIGIFGRHHLNSLTQFNLVFKTPGIPLTLPEIQNAIAHRVEFTSNVAWFLYLARGKIIGVTGTKGKSTTSSLIHHVFQTAGFPTLLLGNIGSAPLSFVTQTTSKTISVLELSAHQLQDLTVSPHFAVVQNITSEHLDYYRHTADYVNAKSSIVRYQKSTDYLLYSDEFKTSSLFASYSKAKRLCYGLKPTPSHLCFVKGHALFYQNNSLPESILNLRLVKLLGKHNLYNIMPAVILAKHFLINNEQIQTAIYSFTPLRHRLEYVATVNNVSYYNDSLSTTPEATIAAINTFGRQPLHLLAGGYERHQDFSKLAHHILKHDVKSVILFPPTGKRLKRALIDLAIKKKQLVPDFYDVTTMSQAVKTAAKVSTPDDTVILSPASASFGDFKDYADRGNRFCTNVKNLL